MHMHAQPNGPRELCGKLPGANILDATPENINDYCCGSWDLVVRDVEATLPAGLACEVLAELARQRVPEAFALRLELVSLKKIAYYLFAQGSSLERQLAQLATFWHGEHLGGAEGAARGYWRHSARLTEVSDARVQCSGAVSATADARALVKHLCCLPRHSSKGCGALLLELPRSLHCWRLVERACAAASAPPPTAADEPPPAAVAGRWHSRLRESLGVQLWPPEAAAVVRASLLCRGADKAVRMRDELSRARAALESCTEAADAALRALQRSPCCAEDALRLLGDEAALDPASARAAAAAAVRRHKHVNLLRGASPVLRVVAGWLRAVETSADQRPAAGEPHTGSARRLFVAGDKRHGEPRGAQPALVAPGGGGGGLELFGELRRVELRYRPQLRAAVAASGWPAQIADRRGAVREKAADNKLCSGCGAQFSALWVHRGVCCECETERRAAQRCPFNGACSACWWCPHDSRCFVCDAWSCAECRMERGAAEVVAAAAARLGPARVALDFDRTLATTRAGSEPVYGKHGCDEELLALLWTWRRASLVLTRNRHTRAIREFLERHGAPPGIEVRHVKKGEAKGAALREGLRPGDTALLVDDSIAELVHPSVTGDCGAEAGEVHRVLFVRLL